MKANFYKVLVALSVYGGLTHKQTVIATAIADGTYNLWNSKQGRRAHHGAQESLSSWINACKELKAADPHPPQKLDAATFSNGLTNYLTDRRKWLGAQQWLNDDKPRLKEHKKAVSRPFEPYARTVIVPDNAQLYLWGDLHGDARALTRGLAYLMKLGVVRDDFAVASATSVAGQEKKPYLIFLGDLTDRGEQGALVVHMVERLQRANPEQVILLRGNHEDIALNQHYGFAQELERRFGKSILKKLIPLVDNFYNTLPVVLYVGVKDQHNKKPHLHYLQCCHGGLEIGYNPSELLARPETSFQLIRALHQKTNASLLLKDRMYCDQNFKNSLQDVTEAELTPGRVGFMWNDFTAQTRSGLPRDTLLVQGEDQKYSFYNPQRGFSFGSDLTDALLMLQSSILYTIGGIFRGHQHNSSMAGLLDNRNQGLFKLHWPQPIFTCCSCSVGNELQLPGNSIAQPGFSQITVTQGPVSSWRLKHMSYGSQGWEESGQSSLRNWKNPIEFGN